MIFDVHNKKAIDKNSLTIEVYNTNQPLIFIKEQV